MHSRIPSVVVAIACALAVPYASADPAGDEAWKKVEAAIKSIKQPEIRPKTREEFTANMKKGLTAYDAAIKDFNAAAPTDPRRWEAKLFDAEVSRGRAMAGLPEGAAPTTVLDEILAAADAPENAKASASGLKVLMQGTAKGEEAWKTAAEEHLKKYPTSQYNPPIERQLKTIAATAEFKTKPLDIKFTAVDGSEVDLAKMRGKVVLIDFWAVWCGPCVAELPNVLKAYEKLHPKGFEIVGISLDKDKARLESFVKEKGMTWPQYYDGKQWQNDISTRFGINSIPAMWLVGKDGMLVSTNVRGRLEEAVEAELAKPAP